MKAIIFDFDGVLVDGSKFHEDIFLEALKKVTGLEMTHEEHHQKLEGMGTRQKLQKLYEEKLIREKEAEAVSNEKQHQTEQKIGDLKFYPQVPLQIKSAINSGLKVCIVTNTRAETMKKFLEKNKDFASLKIPIICPELPGEEKPSPTLYYRALEMLGENAEDVIVVEDSKKGIEAAHRAGLEVFQLRGAKDWSIHFIRKHWDGHAKKTQNQIDYKTNFNYKPTTLVIPCAGLGSRFKEKGFKLPKPLIDVKGKPMIQRVYENLRIRADQTIFIVREDDQKNFKIKDKILAFCPEAYVLEVDGLQQGAYKTLEQAEKVIRSGNALVIANSDQLIDYDPYKVDAQLQSGVSGLILTFDAFGEKWSYAKTDETGKVVEVAEKRQISNDATCGVYYARDAWKFFEAGRKMVEKGDTTNGEYYICPVFNYLAGRTEISPVEKMQGIGTPEDLSNYLTQKQ